MCTNTLKIFIKKLASYLKKTYLCTGIIIKTGGNTLFINKEEKNYEKDYDDRCPDGSYIECKRSE